MNQWFVKWLKRKNLVEKHSAVNFELFEKFVQLLNDDEPENLKIFHVNCTYD